MHRPRFFVVLAILTVFSAATSLAQQAPPARVGRVSFVSGNLAFHTAGQTEGSAAAVNYPVATGASLWTPAADHSVCPAVWKARLPETKLTRPTRAGGTCCASDGAAISAVRAARTARMRERCMCALENRASFTQSDNASIRAKS